MKIQIASDLHLEFLERRYPEYRVLEPTGADLLVLAGDIHRGAQAIEAFRNWRAPVVYVHGNHEPYRGHYDATVRRLRSAAAGTNVHYLERDEYVAKGVRFLGCCLWTDYRLFDSDQLAAMAEADRRLNDHRLIGTDEGIFSARDAAAVHAASRRWLQMKLEEQFSGPTVVVSHHAPHPNSIHPRFAGSIVNTAFASDLTALIGKADLWIHGHVHDSTDYRIAGTRVIANPRGYALNHQTAASREQLEWENPMFDPRLVIRI
jgi:predicted phosphodiesterase